MPLAAAEEPESSQQEDEADMLLMLFIKEKYGVSHTAYHEMAKACKQLPRQYQIQKKIKELNEK